MPRKTGVDVYLEVGSKRVFAGALQWPGWCRSGRDEKSALEALVEYGPRYGSAIRSANSGFKVPREVSSLVVVERLEGNATTDFGAPNLTPAWDERILDETEITRLVFLLRSSWRAFDASARRAGGKSLRKGPRGGGRDIPRMTAHVLEADASYSVQLGARFKVAGESVGERLRQVRKEFVEALYARLRGELPEVGPRGGRRWPPRYAIRRSAWHALDHAWEIEDRVD